MDISIFASDIDELIEAFDGICGLELLQMKELWRARSFSYIHEAKPSLVESNFFMQALYCCTLEYLKPNLAWSKRLGGLYVMYVLYETQLCIPQVKIYLSPVDVENIHLLVKQAKEIGPLTAVRVVNRMMAKDFFLYGSVKIKWKETQEALHHLSRKGAERVELARQRLFASSSALEHFEGSLVKDLGLDGLTFLSEEYALAKQRIFAGAANSAEDGLDSKRPILGVELKNDLSEWIEKQKQFLQSGDKEEKGNEGDPDLSIEGPDDDLFELELELALDEE